MRITTSVINNSFMRNLSKNLGRVQKYHEQLTSGKRVTRPSDDPILVGKIMSMDSSIRLNEQYKSGIRDTFGWVRTQDKALDGMGAGLNRIRDLMIYGATDSLSNTDKEAIKVQLKEEIGHLVDTINTNYDGRYIFSGQQTTEKPFTLDKETSMISYHDFDGADQNIRREIAVGVDVELKTNGKELIHANGAETKDLGELLAKIVKALDRNNIKEYYKDNNKGLTDEEIDAKIKSEYTDASPMEKKVIDKKVSEYLSAKNPDKLGEEYLADIDKHIDNILRVRTEIGAIDNRLEAAEDRNVEENLNLKSSLSQKEDVDLAEKYMEFMTQAAVYQASLSVGAKIMQPSLLDYVR